MQIRAAGSVSEHGYKTSAQDQMVQRTFAGQGADSDIVVSSTRAYVAALNRMIAHLSAGPAAAASMPADEAEVATVV